MTLDDCVEQIRKKEPGVARAASSILFEYFRHKEFLDTLLMGSVSRGIKPELKCIALCALTQALFQSAIAGESAVNIAVEIVKRSRKHRMAAGFMKYYSDGKYAFAALLPDEGVVMEDYIASVFSVGAPPPLDSGTGRGGSGAGDRRMWGQSAADIPSANGRFAGRFDGLPPRHFRFYRRIFVL